MEKNDRKLVIYIIKITDTAKKMIYIQIIISVIGFIIGSILTKDILFFGIGVIYGQLASIIRIILLERSIDKALDMENQQAKNQMQLSFLIRYSLTAIVFVSSALTNVNMMFGAMVGILTLQPAAYCIKFFMRDELNKELRLKAK